MNGYTMMSESYQVLANQGKITKEYAESKCRVFDFLATCSTDDLCTMVDSSAFNDIIIAFLKRAASNAKLSEKQQYQLVNQLRYIFDEKTASEVLGL